MSRVSEFFRFVPPKAATAKIPTRLPIKDQWNPINPTILVGIEVEIENVRVWLDPIGIWSSKDDGSLRNNGREYVSIPLNGSNIPKALLYLFANLNKDIQFSHRTSIHLHFNVQDLEIEALAGVLLTYLAVEPLLFKFVGHDRDKSIFCVPLFETELPNRLIARLRRNPSQFRMENARYAALNLDAIRKFGTLEFRHLYGTGDIDTLMTWLNLILCIFDFGMNQSLEKLSGRILPLNTNSFYIKFVNDVFGRFVEHLDLTAVKFDLERGVKSVKASLLDGSLLSTMIGRTHPESGLVRWITANGLKPRTTATETFWAGSDPRTFGIMNTTSEQVVVEAPPRPARRPR